ncbi:MAG: DNA polymerase III subunit delta [Rhodospirillales bacterium]
MKLAGARLESFLRKPDPAIVAALFYGPDHGLVRERADRLVVAVAGGDNDPFRIAELAADALKDDRTRLADEAASLPFTGGRRVVRVRDGKDVIAPALRVLFEAGNAGGLVVVEAGELPPRSPLRLAFEGADAGAAVACYLDEPEALQKVIVEDLGRYGMTASAEAIDLLTAFLGADRGLTRSELEKLVLYRGEPGRIEAEDVLAIIGDAGALSLDAIVFAACDGDQRALDRSLQMAFHQGISSIAVLRMLARHLQRLLQARAAMAAGRDARAAMASVRPPVFFRLQPQFIRQIGAWPPDRLATALTLVAEAELASKRTGAPQELLCQRTLMQIGELARNRR